MSKKICILVDSLSSGGAEKVAANMSISLSKKGYLIFVVSMQDDVIYSFEGELFNFGKIKTKYNKLRAFVEFNRYFKKQNFDVVIDHRIRNIFFKELFFSKYVFRNSRVIYCIHNYNLSYYFSYLNWPFFSRLPHVKDSTFVSVCNEINNHLNEKLKLKSKTIYNYLKFSGLSEMFEENQVLSEKYIIAVGRLTKVKQFDKLVRSYQASELSERGIKLIILGDGPEKQYLKTLISRLNLENFIELLPFRKKPYSLIHSAKALVLTSKVEGFPMVLLEALSLKTPIIAFNCKSGPNEIIINEINGLLVENQNEEKLTMALNKLMTDDSFYNKIKKNVHIGLEKFSEEKIIHKWLILLENQV